MDENRLTPAMRRVMELAEIEARAQEELVGTWEVLLGILLEGENGMSQVLKDAGFTVEGMRKGEYPGGK